ncbi:MAG: recombination mediator RecR [Rikenellaceae bacterium]
MSKLLQDVVGELTRLPGVGRRTALRLALHILKMEREEAKGLAESIDNFSSKIRFCVKCNNLSDDEVCPICNDTRRDHSTVCVVEQVSDLLSIENTQQYNGVYHVLGGVISPMQGVGPSDLHIDKLVDRAKSGAVSEIILALSTSVEGETTHFYIMNRLRDIECVKTTSIARGIGFGDELEYVDEMTITHALNNRR